MAPEIRVLTLAAAWTAQEGTEGVPFARPQNFVDSAPKVMSFCADWEALTRPMGVAKSRYIHATLSTNRLDGNYSRARNLCLEAIRISFL